MFCSSLKQKIDPKIKTAQDFINVEDVSDGLLWSVDGYLFGYLSIRAGDNKLRSDEERVADAASLATSLASEKEPWQLLSVPRTVNTLGMISTLAEMRKSTREDARLKLISGEIAALQELTREGTKEPLIVLKVWIKASRGADGKLKKRLHELRARLVENKIAAELMPDQEIVYLCKVFADLTTYQVPEEDYAEEVPVLAGQKRAFGHAPQAPGNADLLNLLTPVGGLNFGVNRVTVGDVLGRVYGAIRYPAELDYGWAIDLMNTSDSITCITYTAGNASVLGDALSRSIKANAKEAYSESDARKRKRFERQATDADTLIEEMDYKSAAIGHMTLLVMPFCAKEEDFDDLCHNTVERYGRKRIKLKSLGSLQQDAYKHLSPYHIPQLRIDDVLAHIMPLETIMGGNPMTVNIYRDDKGYYFGRTMDGGIISLDLLYRGRDRTNSNIVTTGAAGSGKSTALKHIIESLYMSGVKIIVIDPEREFKDLCQNLGGSWFDAGGGGEAKINPLQIRPVPVDDEEERGEALYKANDNAMALHIHTLEVFFKLYLPMLTDLQRALLKNALVEIYKQSGIAWETDVTAIPADKFPTVSDLYKHLISKQKTEPRYEEIAVLLEGMADGADSFLWNGHTNIEVSNAFVCFDTNRLQNSSDEIKRAQYFNLLTMCWELMSRDRTEPVCLVCDEAHIMLDPANPQTSMFLRNMAKRDRKYEAMLCVAMQSVVDALHPEIKLYGQAILDNSTYKLLFGTDGQNLAETVDLFCLTNTERDILARGGRGKALCFIGQQHVHVDFVIPEYKMALMGKGGGR